LFANTTSYFGLVADGKIPGDKFIVPEGGQFLNFSANFAELFDPVHRGVLAVQMASWRTQSQKTRIQLTLPN
jgi:hypothetical protein